MGFLFDPKVRENAQSWLAEELVMVKRQMESSLPFAMDPVVYDFRINDRGSYADALVGDRSETAPAIPSVDASTAASPVRS